MDSGPCDLRHPDRIRRPLGRHASCIGKTVWEHSPTPRKYWEITRLNRGAQMCVNCVTAPLSYQGPTVPMGPPTAVPTCHVAPHTGAHVDSRGCVAPCHVAAPLRLMRPAWATHGSATWPQRRVAPVRWSRAPRVSSPELPLTTSAPGVFVDQNTPFSQF